MTDHREAPAPTLMQRLQAEDRPPTLPERLQIAIEWAEAHPNERGQWMKFRTDDLRAMQLALAERADGSEPEAWMVERQKEGEWRWVGASNHEDEAERFAQDERRAGSPARVVPLYRRAERAEPDGAMREVVKQAHETLTPARDLCVARTANDALLWDAAEVELIHYRVLWTWGALGRALASAPQRAGTEGEKGEGVET